MEQSKDRAVMVVIDGVKKAGYRFPLAWERYEAQLPQCSFGELGLCCRHCLQGPCRIDPFGDGPQHGVCGATADVMVARGVARAVAAGAASHAGHAKHVAHTLLRAARGEAKDYFVKDTAKLQAVARKAGVATEDKTPEAIALEVAEKALAEFSEREAPLAWTLSTLPEQRIVIFKKLGVLPYGVDSAISEVMHRTTYGVDAEPLNILLGAVKCAIADYTACHIATDLSDILFGTPGPVSARANLGVIKRDAVNIALHGHNPLLSDIMVQVAREPELLDRARAAGASGGINLVGICCTGNEVLMRHGVPLATSSVSQETAILTGAVDAMVVDYQCVMPSLASVAECYHSKLITTMPIAKIAGAQHFQFDEASAKETARRIVEAAIEAFHRRDPARVNIPDVSYSAVAGFSAEAIVGALARVSGEDPLKPLLDNIVSGNIAGVCLFAGCNTVKVTQDANYLAMVRELARNNVLILCTGCAAGTFARHGLMRPEATEEYAGPGLKGVLEAVGEVAGLGGPLPLVLHLGSCVDNSRAVDIAVAVAGKLGVDMDKLPVVASAPEPVTEKAVAIGTWAVALGIPTHVGVVPPIHGSRLVAGTLTAGIKELFGGYFIAESDPLKAAQALLAAIKERRRALGLAA
jgi:carbon-monoxide dehydrogenase catalytic subunit